jgi:hypothetical protein
MNENYLKYLFSTASPYGRFNDPFEMSFEMDPESVVERIRALLKEEDITFLKKEGIKPMEFVKKKSVFDFMDDFNLNNMSGDDMEYLKARLIEALQVPPRLFNNTDPIDYFDEYH